MYTYAGLHTAQGTTIFLPADTSIAGIGSDKNRKQNCLGLLPVKSSEDDFFRTFVVLIPDTCCIPFPLGEEERNCGRQELLYPLGHQLVKVLLQFKKHQRPQQLVF
jgi:hypothetical protein